MEASLVTNHSMVPQLLEDDNYKTWRIFMEHYLLGQDLWDVVTQPKPKPDAKSDNQYLWEDEIKSWRRENAMALHAIKMSCGPKFLPLVLELTSSKEAWNLLASAGNSIELNLAKKTRDLLASAANSQPEDEEDEGSQEEDVSDNNEEDNGDIGYSPFIKAIEEDDLRAMNTFIDYHPDAISARAFSEDKTALHYALSKAKKEMAMRLVERMTADDLAILDENGYTTLAQAVLQDYPGVLDLLELMVNKNPRLPNIGATIPVKIASERGNKNLSRFLYSVTDKSILSPECGKEGIYLLSGFIDMEIYDLAADLVRLFPDILLHEDTHGITPIKSLAKTFHVFSSEGEGHQSRYNDYHDFVNSVCTAVSAFDDDELSKSVYPAMIYAAMDGNTKFIKEMITANPLSLGARDYYKGKSMFWHAVQNRQEKVFSFLYYAYVYLPQDYDSDTGNNILHLAAKLPFYDVLERISSSPDLILQREALWFKEVWSLVSPSQREARNKEGLTPRQVYSRSHVDLIPAGEKLIKETGTSSTVVGALIVTIMFAAAFTVPGGNNQAKGYPIFANKILFKLFIICDVLSLSSSATSILVFLTILANSYTDEDFLLDLPRRLMIGVLTLFFSITTMMMTFCLALALMLNGRLLLILPIAFIASVPVFLFSIMIFPLVSSIFNSTSGSSIIDRNTKRLTPWDRIALVIARIRRKAALKAMSCGMRAKPEEMDSMV